MHGWHLATKHYCAVLACIGSATSAINGGYSIGFNSPAIQDFQNADRSLHMNPDQISWFGSILPLTALFGSLLVGPMMDLLGRRSTILVVNLCFAAGWTSMFFSTTLAFLFCSRGLLGFSTGMCTVAIPVYVSEVSPSFLRGALSGMFSVLLATGIPAAYIAGLMYEWKKMAEIGAVIGCFTFLVSIALPESPYWLMRRGNSSDARHILQILRTDTSYVDSELKDIEYMQEQLRDRVTLYQLMKSSFLRPIMLGLCLMIFQQFSGVNAIFFYAHEIFHDAGFEHESLASILVSSIHVLCLLVAVFVIDYVGRKRLLLVSAIGTMACHIVIGFCMFNTQLSGQSLVHDNRTMLDSSGPFANSEMYANIPSARSKYPNTTVEFNPNATIIAANEDTGKNQAVFAYFSLVAVVLYIVFYSAGLGPVPYIAVGEMLPQKIKGVAGGLVTMSNWLCAFAITKSFYSIIFVMTIAGAFWLFAGVCLITAVFVWKLVPETKGKTLCEIQDLFLCDEKRNFDANTKPEYPKRLQHNKTISQLNLGSPLLIPKHRSASIMEETTILII